MEPSRLGLGKILHRPDVVLVAKRAEKILPERLLPAGVPCARSNLGGLVFKPNLRGFTKEFRQLNLAEFLQRCITFAAQGFRQRAQGFIF